MSTISYDPEYLREKIEDIIHSNLEQANMDMEMSYSILRRDNASVKWNEETGIFSHSGQKRRIVMNGKSARKFTAISLVLNTAYELLACEKTVTQREIYYMYKFFKNQSEADEAILDACSLLGVPRICLNIVGSAKGWFAGKLFIQITGNWLDCSKLGPEGHSITHEILKLKSQQIASTAKWIIIVEKDGIFNRLSEDRFFDRLPCVLVTGKGYPDLATRTFVKKLSVLLNIPVLGLCDCNPYGLSVLLTYKLGSARMPLDSPAQTVNIKWLGIRPSSLKAYEDITYASTNDGLQLPDRVLETLSPMDEKKVQSLLKSDFIQNNPLYKYEVLRFSHVKVKVELEALHSLGFDTLDKMIIKKINAGDFL